VFRTQISNDSKTIALLLADFTDKANPKICMGLFNLDGDLLTQQDYNIPENERFGSTGEISFNGESYIHRYIGSNRITKEKLQYRSAVLIFDPKTNEINTSCFINSRLYNTLKDDGFIVVSDKYIKGWSRKEK